MAARSVEYLNPEGACPAQGLYSHVGKVDRGGRARPGIAAESCRAPGGVNAPACEIMWVDFLNLVPS